MTDIFRNLMAMWVLGSLFGLPIALAWLLQTHREKSKRETLQHLINEIERRSLTPPERNQLLSALHTTIMKDLNNFSPWQWAILLAGLGVSYACLTEIRHIANLID